MWAALQPTMKIFYVRKLSGASCHKQDFEPFTHRIYTLSMYEDLTPPSSVGVIKAPSSIIKAQGSIIRMRFKTPHQVVTPAAQPFTLDSYFVCWSEKFLLEHKALAGLVNAMPFFRRTYYSPLELSAHQ